jgi:hypothetical protein
MNPRCCCCCAFVTWLFPVAGLDNWHIGESGVELHADLSSGPCSLEVTGQGCWCPADDKCWKQLSEFNLLGLEVTSLLGRAPIKFFCPYPRYHAGRSSCSSAGASVTTETSVSLQKKGAVMETCN